MQASILEVNKNSLSPARFTNEYTQAKLPVLIKGVADNWLATKQWTIDYFAQQHGHIYSGCFYLKNHVSELNAERGSRLDYLPLQQCMAAINSVDGLGGISVATPLEVFNGGLDNDFIVPDLCAQKKFLRKRLFISPVGAITTLHQDLFDNLYVVVRGEKKIVLYPPSSEVYANSRFSKLPNHAQVNPEQPDYERFPKFRDVTGYNVVVKAGECLYIPSMWWHHLHTKQTTIALSFWWTEGWITPLARAAAWYKKFRNI